MKFKVVKGETEHISLRGARRRNPTVLIQVGAVSVSRKALVLGALLAALQVLDGALTFAGVSLYGVGMEGNSLIRELAAAYGAAPALFFVKVAAILFVVFLTVRAHRRRWIRPIIAGLIVTYVLLAILPWAVVISGHLLAAP